MKTIDHKDRFKQRVRLWADKLDVKVVWLGVRPMSNKWASCVVFRAIDGLRDRIGLQHLRQGQLEQLAQGNELARAIVLYRRLQQQMRQLDAICKGERNGKVFPLFSQLKAPLRNPVMADT